MRNKTSLITGLIITGVGRSGTTLLWQILNAHSKLNIAYEPFSHSFPVEDLKYFDGFKQPAFYWDFNSCVADKYIFLKRNTWDCLYSLILRNNKDLSIIQKYYNNLKKVDKQIDNFVEANHEKSLIVHYEKLCSETEIQIKRVCKFLEINFEKDMLINWKNVMTPYWAISAQYKFDKIKIQKDKYNQDLKFLKIIEKLKMEDELK